MELESLCRRRVWKAPYLAKTMAAQAAAGGRKRIFLGLLSLSCLAVCLFLLIFLILPWLGTHAVWLPYVSMSAGIAGIVILAWICLTLVFHIYTGKKLPGIAGMRHLCIRLFLPLMEIVGKIAGVDKAQVRRSFIKVNNEFVCAGGRRVQPDKMLLLLPHCMQYHACKRRLGPGLENCAGCGKCQLGMLNDLAASKGIRAAIATGGTIARRIVCESRPLLIIAVACERDLVSGIQDSYPVPVFGILNERPCGPCCDTLVPLPALAAAIDWFLEQPR